jgi:hypothetical protein
MLLTVSLDSDGRRLNQTSGMEDRECYLDGLSFNVTSLHFHNSRVSNILERNAMMVAQSLAIQAERLIQQALSISSEVHDIGAFSDAIARG